MRSLADYGPLGFDLSNVATLNCYFADLTLRTGANQHMEEQFPDNRPHAKPSALLSRLTGPWQ